jgi:hypothetical protein
VKLCSWSWSHEFVHQDMRAWFAKVTNAKGLKCVCWLCVAGAWGRVSCGSDSGRRNKPTEHEDPGHGGRGRCAEEISRQNIKLR